MTTARRGIRHDGLAVAHIVFAATFVFHGLDHVRQGLDRLNTTVFWGGNTQGVAAIASLVLTLAWFRKAPLVAAVVGFGSAVIAASSHLLPHWSAASDPYWDLSLDAWSWAAMLSEIVAGIVVGIVALGVLRRTQTRPLTAITASTPKTASAS
jgi:uncharacterized membrane protein YphA (DoxX/SURF4 family)